MPELPEIYTLAGQMNRELSGKVIAGIEVIQPKSLNIPEGDFTQALTGSQIHNATCRGKWVMVETSQGWLLLSLGMGGEILLVTRQTLPEKYRLVFDFSDGSCLAVNFWWFGYAHYAAPNELEKHKMTASLGPNAIDLTRQDLARLLAGRRGGLKAFLTDQSRIAGIGNVYIQDILFLARLHPLREIQALSPADIDRLADAIHSYLQSSIDKGGFEYEVDLHGQKGSFGTENFLVAYKEGQPCPSCGTIIEKIKTGSTSSFICPNEQRVSP
jgi:formamidopyrimidine-DNA glycosylase